MASVQNSIQNSQTRTVQHNHVIIQYQQPPDPAIVNRVLEILVAIARSYASKERSTDTICPGLFRPNSTIFTNSL